MFDWDNGNKGKNLARGVQDWEIEEAILDPNAQPVERVWFKREWRYKLLGRSETSGKYLRVIYTIRLSPSGEERIRLISAVEMTPAEKRRYRKK